DSPLLVEERACARLETLSALSATQISRRPPASSISKYVETAFGLLNQRGPPGRALSEPTGENGPMADPKTPAPRATSNRSTTPASDAFRDYISSNWAEREDAVPAPREQAPYAAA